MRIPSLCPQHPRLALLRMSHLLNACPQEPVIIVLGTQSLLFLLQILPLIPSWEERPEWYPVVGCERLSARAEIQWVILLICGSAGAGHP